MKVPGKKAFTVLEILIAAIILASFMGGVYKVFRSVARSQEISAWCSGTTTFIRNGLTLVRNEIGRVCKPKKMTQKGIEEIDDQAAVAPYEKLKLPALSDRRITNFSANKPILVFYMCKPSKEGIPGEPDRGCEIMKGELKIENGKIYYERSVVTNQNVPPEEQTHPLKQLICETPLKVEISLRKASDQNILSVKLRNFVGISITAVHPKYPTTKIVEEVEAPFEVEPLEGGT